ncbi:MAG: peptide chain release factor N(5)-glutamine methyltransferase [Lachnospiraceae bacterium]|jgi:release factor glutamine methyltransferase
MTLRELYAAGVDRLDEAGIDSPSADAFYLLEHVTGLGRQEYLLNKDRQIRQDVEVSFLKLIEERAGRVPYQYLISEAGFMGYKLYVDPSVMIPRLDTEVLAMEALSRIPEGKADVLDMCTGSGCIAVALKCERPKLRMTACDISEEALAVARVNAASNGAEITLLRGDLFEKVEGLFDMIVSNPPYVAEEEYRELAPEIARHEPKLALLAGADGLDIYKRLIPEAAGHLRPGGCLIMEIGCNQAKKVSRLMKTAGYKKIEIIKDLAGLDRVICGRI